LIQRAGRLKRTTSRAGRRTHGIGGVELTSFKLEPSLRPTPFWCTEDLRIVGYSQGQPCEIDMVD
jgi:hypothetical protein